MKPCPFCDSRETGMEGSLHGAFAVMCYACGTKGPVTRKAEIAVLKWNQRGKEKGLFDGVHDDTSQ